MDENTVYKSFAMEVPPDEEGRFKAIVAMYDVLDKQGEYVAKGEFTDGDQAMISASTRHGNTQLQEYVGIATVYDRGDHAELDGRFFLETSAGHDAYVVAKAGKDILGLSYGARCRRQRTSRGTALKSIKPFEWTITPGPIGEGTKFTVLKAETAEPEPEPPPTIPTTPYPVPEAPLTPRQLQHFEDL